MPRLPSALLLGLGVLSACSSHPRLESGVPLIEAGSPGKREVWRRDLGRALEIAPVPVDRDWIIAPTEGSLMRLRGKDGKEMWRRKLRSGVTSAPVISGSTLVVSTDVNQAEVMGIALSDGRVKWKWGNSVGFLAAMDSLVVFAGRGGRIVAFNPESGAVKWERSRPGSGWRAPAADNERRLVFVPVRPDSVVALSDSGSVRWSRKVGSWPHLSVARDGLIVVTDDSTVVRLDPITGEERARRSLNAMAAGDPVVHEDVVYLALRNGTLLTVDAETLSDRWRARFEPPLVSAPLAGRDFIAQSGTRGRVYLMSPTGAPIDTLHHPEALEASPGFAQDRLAVGGMGGTLVLFRKQNG